MSKEENTPETFEEKLEQVLEADSTEVDEGTNQLNSAEETKSEDEVTEAKEDDQQAEEVDGQESTDTDFEFPKDWSEQQRALFTEATPEQKAMYVEMQKGIQRSHTNKFSTWENEVKKPYENDYQFGQQVRELFPEQLKTFLNAKGLDEVSALRMTIANLIQENQDPRGYMQMVAQRNGMDIRQLAHEIIQSEQERDPYEVKLEQTMNPVLQELNQLKGYVANQQQRGVDSLVDGFVNATNENGEPKYPHFDKVEDLMVRMLPEGKNANNLSVEELDAMYNNAVMATPELRELELQKYKQSASEQQRVKQDAVKASSAGKTVKSTPGKQTNAPQTWDDFEKGLLGE